MAKKKTIWQNAYIKRSYDMVRFTVPKGEKETLKSHAEAGGESLTAFIKRAIATQLALDEKEKENGDGL